MEKNLEYFLLYLEKEHKKSKNTIDAYTKDIKEFADHVKAKACENLAEVSNSHIVGYILDLKNSGKSAATVNRKMSSLRAFYRFMIEKGLATNNPAIEIKTPKIKQKEIDYLTIDEIDKLLSLPADSLKGKRDRAILELMYATGIRVSEVTELQLKDINLRLGYLSLTGEHTRARIAPMGRPAKAAMENYIYDIRPKLIKNKERESPGDPLFVNYAGKKLSRQGLWKIIKEYGAKAGMADRISPQIFRNSFAVHMLHNGADLKSLQELLGHEDPATTQIFLSVSKNKIKDVYDKTHPRA